MPETTPIVFSIVTYPADSGLVESFEYSGNNLDGTSNYVEVTQYIRLLGIAFPDAKRRGTSAHRGFSRPKDSNSEFE